MSEEAFLCIHHFNKFTCERTLTVLQGCLRRIRSLVYDVCLFMTVNKGQSRGALMHTCTKRNWNICGCLRARGMEGSKVQGGWRMFVELSARQVQS